MFLNGFIGCIKQHIDNECHNTNSSTIRITPLHGSILIRELIEFYKVYERVCSFVSASKSLANLPKDHAKYGTSRSGMYIMAFVDALIEIEKLYIDDLRKLEKVFLFQGGIPELAISDPDVESSSVLVVSTMRDTYVKLHRMTNCIDKNNFHGCQILNYCLKCKHFLPENIYCLLLKYLNKPLLKQIYCWIALGKLEDAYDEFFIKPVSLENVGYVVETGSSLDDTLSSKCSTEIIEESFEIDANYVPCHIPFSLVYKILNTGKLTHLLCVKEDICGPSSAYGDFVVNDDYLIKVMKRLEEGDYLDLHELSKVVYFVNSMVNTFR